MFPNIMLSIMFGCVMFMSPTVMLSIMFGSVLSMLPAGTYHRANDRAFTTDKFFLDPMMKWLVSQGALPMLVHLVPVTPACGHAQYRRVATCGLSVQLSNGDVGSLAADTEYDMLRTLTNPVTLKKAWRFLLELAVARQCVATHLKKVCAGTLYVLTVSACGHPTYTHTQRYVVDHGKDLPEACSDALDAIHLGKQDDVIIPALRKWTKANSGLARAQACTELVNKIWGYVQPSLMRVNTIKSTIKAAPAPAPIPISLAGFPDAALPAAPPKARVGTRNEDGQETNSDASDVDDDDYKDEDYLPEVDVDDEAHVVTGLPSVDGQECPIFAHLANNTVAMFTGDATNQLFWWETLKPYLMAEASPDGDPPTVVVTSPPWGMLDASPNMLNGTTHKDEALTQVEVSNLVHPHATRYVCGVCPANVPEQNA